MSSSFEFSVVIPTFNRLEILPEVLSALACQEEAPSFEVLVVDDGSTDGTGRWLSEARPPFALRVLSQENRGPAVARNRGVEQARGNRVAFLGDDTVPSAGWLHQHARRHQSSAALAARQEGKEVGVIGYTRWHRRMKLNPFLRYINEYGLQFGFSIIEDRDDVPFNFFYTSNLSLSRGALLAHPFDVRFPHAAWEDIEVGYRLQKKGFRLLYEANATVDHLHPTTLRRFAARQQKAGYNAVVMRRLHPELGHFVGLPEEAAPSTPSRAGHLLRWWVASALQNTSAELPKLWEQVLRYYYIRGLQQGLRERAGMKTSVAIEGESQRGS